MSATALRERYMGDAVATASPVRLLTMLYDRLTLDLERAQFALGAGDRAVANEQLRHAQEIVIELRAGLNVDLWAGGPGLAALYGWILKELMTANTTGDQVKVGQCVDLVEPLRQAWHEAASQSDTTRS
ncbi:flagellar export chaperone FliS [Tessaracoccus sp.]